MSKALDEIRAILRAKKAGAGGQRDLLLDEACGSPLSPGFYIAGVQEAEYRRLYGLGRRPVTPADISGEDWDESLHGRLLLREDGVLVAVDSEQPVGYVEEGGGVRWVCI